MGADGKTATLFAWLTVVNSGTESFKNARLQVVAGQPNKEQAARLPVTSEPQLFLQCWPMDNTSTHPNAQQPNPQSLESGNVFEDIAVTSKRSFSVASPVLSASAPRPVIAKQEELGDLKLYRVPIRVTLAAQSQKQVAMINQPAAKFDRVYSVNVGESGGKARSRAMPTVLRTRNVKEKGLGLPLPAGGIAIFEPQNGQSILTGEDDVKDRAIGEEFDVNIGESPDVRYLIKPVNAEQSSISITNARNIPIMAEVILSEKLYRKPPNAIYRRGGWALPIQVRANSSALITYEVKRRKP
jgi:hypothetical protein